MRATLIALILTSCAATPTYYDPEPWAKMTFDEARAKCEADVQRSLTLSINTCIASHGWRAR